MTDTPQSTRLDPRLNAYRADLAANHLRGEVDAPKFAPGKDFQIIAPVTPLTKGPSDPAPIETQLLFGEVFRVYDEGAGWAWGQAARDDYVGYIARSALTPAPVLHTHTVAALRTFVYSQPDIKRRPLMSLSMNARVAVTAARGAFSQLSNSGWIFTDHLASTEEKEKDFVAVAERFIGVPYLWGGRESLGLDCSALVQTALERAGFHALRDSDMQEATLGEALPTPLDLTSLQRGDLIFWKVHVSIMQDGETLLHANATHMCTASEPFLEAVARIAKSDGDITSIRRLPSLGA